MSDFRLAAAALLGLSACVPVGIYHREGVPVQKQSSDLTTCQAKAARDVPPNTQVRHTPVYVTPTHTNCYTNNGVTNCSTTGGYVSGGNAYTVDVNAELRERVVAQCMAAKGYQLYSLPQCQSRDIKGKPLGYAKLPPITAESCVTRGARGEWVIVNP